jgi:hypothetical protein
MNIPTLVVLGTNNIVFIFQNDNLKKMIEIDVSNINIIEAIVKDINL